MKKLKNHTLKEYLDNLSKKTPTPGGGSAAALTAASGAALISMVTNYSIGRRGQRKSVDTKLKSILKKSEKIRKRLLELVDLDAQAYMKVVNSRKKSLQEKRKARRGAQKVPYEVCQLCYKAMDLAPYLVKNGNPYLLSDVTVSIEFLLAAFKSAKANVEVNQ